MRRATRELIAVVVILTLWWALAVLTLLVLVSAEVWTVKLWTFLGAVAAGLLLPIPVALWGTRVRSPT